MVSFIFTHSFIDGFIIMGQYLLASCDSFTTFSAYSLGDSFDTNIIRNEKQIIIYMEYDISLVYIVQCSCRSIIVSLSFPYLVFIVHFEHEILQYGECVNVSV